MEQINSLEHLMACLTTHPHYLNQVLNNPVQFIAGFNNLSKKEKSDFAGFFKTYTKRFVAATSLISKKRWEEAALGLESILSLLPETQLRLLWDRYIATYRLEESIPENPLNDALNFIEYLKITAHFTTLTSDFLEYQSIKLKLLLINEENKKLDFIQNVFYKTKITDLKIRPNDSLIIKVFSSKISRLVDALKSSPEIENESNYIGNENLAIYINRYKKNVSTVLLSDYLRDLLEAINHDNVALSCFNKLSGKYPLEEEAFINNLLKLHELDLVEMEYIQI